MVGTNGISPIHWDWKVFFPIDSSVIEPIETTLNQVDSVKTFGLELEI